MRRVRKAQNLTLDGLSSRTGIPVDRLRRIDSGDIPPYLSEALRISDALHTTMDALARGLVTVQSLGAFRRVAENLPQNRTTQEGEFDKK